jgi:intracellular sulfur oxidation DsrE/DsrF family protein
MFIPDRDRSLPRRSFLSRFGAAVAATGAALTATQKRVRAQATVGKPWEPARHAQDDWLGQLAGTHRFVFDTTTPDGFSSALTYANNYFVANQSGYGLKDSDLAVVLVARHHSTQFAYNDAIWKKYREQLVKAATATTLPSLSDRLDPLLKRGVHLAVCMMATRRIAGTIAASTGGNTDRVYEELAANLVSQAHLVPAGIVAVNRAQERGYSLAHAG